MKRYFPIAAVAALFAIAPGKLQAHCDGWDGPVVQAGRQALESGDLRPALAWIQAKDEAEVRDAFRQARAVRTLSPAGKELADRYFFETLVRIHRAGENAPYTGLQPAGRDLGPAIPAADKAIRTRSVEPLLRLLSGGMEAGLRERFERVLQTSKARNDSVEAGRAYVAAYVDFVHYVEGVHEAAAAHGENARAEH